MGFLLHSSLPCTVQAPDPVPVWEGLDLPTHHHHHHILSETQTHTSITQQIILHSALENVCFDFVMWESKKEKKKKTAFRGVDEEFRPQDRIYTDKNFVHVSSLLYTKEGQKIIRSPPVKLEN